MIFVDVTAACLLPLQSGIPRTTRELYRELSAHAGGRMVKPMVWQPFYFSYTVLSGRSRALLDNPFDAAVQKSETPRDSTWPLLWAGLKDAFRLPARIPLNHLADAGNTVLLTSIFPDNRLLYLKKLLGKPGRKIAIFHDAIPLQDPHVAGWEKKLHLATLRILARMDLVVCVSAASEQQLIGAWEKNGIPPGRTKVVAWPVPFTTQRPAFSFPGWEKKKILYVARLKRVKNHRVLLDACLKLWKEHKDFTLELIGCEDEPEESSEILGRIAALQKQGFPLVWRGHVRDEELHEAYRSSTFTVFPSLIEGFGLPIIESFWHGRAVVCGEDGAVGEVSNGPGAVVADVTDVDDLAGNIRRLLEDKEHCLHLSGEAYGRPVRTWQEYWQELRPCLEPPENPLI